MKVFAALLGVFRHACTRGFRHLDGPQGRQACTARGSVPGYTARRTATACSDGELAALAPRDVPVRHATPLTCFQGPDMAGQPNRLASHEEPRRCWAYWDGGTRDAAPRQGRPMGPTAGAAKLMACARRGADRPSSVKAHGAGPTIACQNLAEARWRQAHTATGTIPRPPHRYSATAGS